MTSYEEVEAGANPATSTIGDAKSLSTRDDKMPDQEYFLIGVIAAVKNWLPLGMVVFCAVTTGFHQVDSVRCGTDNPGVLEGESGWRVKLN